MKTLTVKFKNTSLDYPCDFCNHNSYGNFHVEKDGKLIMNICPDCVPKQFGIKEISDKEYEEYYNKLATGDLKIGFRAGVTWYRDKLKEE